MKDSTKETHHPEASSSNLEPRAWPHRGSVSSHRSIKSGNSHDSFKSRKSRKSRTGRPRARRFSLSSLASQAVSVNSSSSADTNNLSRKTSHADDSDASDTNESLGETEEDVWFPIEARENGDINVDELDQLLNLSAEEDGNYAEGAAVRPTFREPASSGSPPHQQKLGDNDAGSLIERGKPLQRLQSTPRKKSFGSVRDDRLDMAEPIPEVEDGVEEDLDNMTGSPTRRKKFVEYRPVNNQTFVEKTYDVHVNSYSGGTSSSSDFSEKKQKEQDLLNQSSSSGEQCLQKTKDESPNSDETNETGAAGAAGDSRASHLTPPPFRKRGSSYVQPRPSNAGASSRFRRTSRNDDGEPESTSPTANVGTGAAQGAQEDQQSQRYSFFAPGLENTIHAPDLASLVGESNSFSSLFNPDNGTWFLDCFRPTDVEMKAISRAFGIHPLTTEDIQTEDAREKYELFKNYYLVVYHTFENDKEDPNYMEAINFYVLVFKEGVISFHFEPVSHCRSVRRRMRQLRDYLNFTPDWIAYALIDDITDSFAPEIQMVEKEADFIEDAVYLDHDGSIEMSTLLRRLGEGRRHTMHLLRMLSGKADVVRGFAKRINERGMPSEMNFYLGDIQDHIVTMYQNLSAYEKIFSRTHFNYMGLLQMEFVDSSNRMTGVLGKVTILGTVLVPMNLITGLFGMNVKVPGQEVENLRWFFGILGLVLFLIVTLLLGSGLYVKFSINRRNPARVANQQ